MKLISKYVENGREFETIFKIWDLQDSPSGKSARATLSDGRQLDQNYAPDKKIIDDGIVSQSQNGKYYVNSKWSAIFINEAFNKLKKYQVKNEDSIINVQGELSNEPYGWVTNKDGEKINSSNGTPLKRYGLLLKIRNFDLYTPNTNASIDKAPIVEETSKAKEDDYPF